MDPPYLGFPPEPSEFCNLGMGEKRGLIRELAKCPQSAQEKLQKWSRRDLMEILRAEMGKERKYTGVPKQKLIEYIFRIVSLKKPDDLDGDRKSPRQSPRSPRGLPKRLRKIGHPMHIPITTTSHASAGGDKETVGGAARYCTNLACKATLSEEDCFCKRCSCCICLKFDDNKDPSLWLVCGSETLSEDVSCGMSCHLECAMKHERAGIAGGSCTRLDGSFYCVYCGRTNDLLGCWRKQLMVAKDARRIDVLCYRISLSHRILLFTEKYQELHAFVDLAMKKLRDEIGPLDDISNMGRGIVNRLSVGSEVQELCAEAVASLDSFLETKSPADPHMQGMGMSPSSVLKFEDVSPKSITVILDSWEELSEELVGYALWHRKAGEEYPTEPTFRLSEKEPRFVVAELAPATEYAFKLVASSDTGELGSWEARARTGCAPIDAGSDFVIEVASRMRHKRPPKESSCGTADRSSEGDVASDAVAYRDLNRFPESCFGYDENPCSILDLEKSPEDACKEASQSKGSEDTPGHSISTLDEEPISTIQPESESRRGSAYSTGQHHSPDSPRQLGDDSAAQQRHEMAIVPNGCANSSPTDIRAKPSSRVLENEMPPPPPKPAQALSGGSSKKRSGAKCEQLCVRDESPEGEYEHCVKVIRWLECEGHIETNFRVKLLTWFSLRATPQERRVVGVFIDTLIDDPGSLAGQLVDAFSEAALCRKRHSPAPTVFCSRLWH